MRNRDGFTEMLGDMLFNIPAIKTVNAHRGKVLIGEYTNTCYRTLSQTKPITPICRPPDAGAPVYLYEYRYPPHVMLNKRPDFVGCDHGDEIFTVLGLCFTTVDVTLAGKKTTIRDLRVSLKCKVSHSTVILDPCLEEQEELSRIMMSYWGNFARTG